MGGVTAQRCQSVTFSATEVERAPLSRRCQSLLLQPGMNSYFAMPFGTGAKITVTNEHPVDFEGFFFQIDYCMTQGSESSPSRFHAQWRRENPTKTGRDYTILDGVRGRGAYIGTFLSITALERYWWGEGEVKFYIDGDDEHPTICGTGLEDYAGGAWAFQDRLRGRLRCGVSRPARRR